MQQYKNLDVDEAVFLTMIPENKGLTFKSMQENPTLTTDLFKEIEHQHELTKESKSNPNSDSVILDKIIKNLGDKMGRMSHTKINEYEKVKQVMKSCLSHKHFRKRNYSINQSKSRVLSAKKTRVHSAKPVFDRKVFGKPQTDEKENINRKKQKKHSLKTSLRHRFGTGTTTSNNFKKVSAPHSTPFLFQASAQKLYQKKLLREKIQFQDRCKELIDNCEKEKQENVELKKKVQKFCYYCSKVNHRLIEKKKTIQKNVENDFSYQDQW